jgi:putative redox protein
MGAEQPRGATPALPTGADGDWLTVRLQGSGFRTEVRAGAHAFVADEPRAVGGTDAGPTPYDYLLGALGACTAMTVRMYASRKGWPLEEVVVQLRNARSHARDCADCESKPVGFRRLERRLELRGPLTEEQRQRLAAIADRCPVKQTLEHGIEIEALPEGEPRGES